MIKNVYTYSRILLVLLLISLFFFETKSRPYPFFITLVIFALSIPVKKLIQKYLNESTNYFETKLNYFLDEFFVYPAVILLSLYDFAPFWVVIIYFYKDATIGAVRNFAIKNKVKLNEKFGYKIDKFVQYSVIIISAFYLIHYPNIVVNPNNSFPLEVFGGAIVVRVWTITLFYVSAAISFITLILFFVLNRSFMKRIQES